MKEKIMKIFFKVFSKLMALSLPLQVSSCVSFTTAQTARILKKGESAGFIGLQVKNQKTIEDEYLEVSGSSFETSSNTHNDGFFGGYSYGINDQLEFGAKGSNGDIFMLTSKFGLLQKESHALALGLDYGYANYRTSSKIKEDSASIEGGSSSRNYFRQLTLPLYFSVDFSEETSFYSALKYHYIASWSDDQDSDDESHGSLRMASATVGGVYGSDISVFGEVTYFQDLDKRLNTKGSEFAAGLIFNRP